MAQFDVYRNSNIESNKVFPYLLDVQNSLHERTSTRMVIPLAVGMKSVRNLMPEFMIDGESVVLSTMNMAGISLEVLGDKIDSLEEQRSQIIDAIDFLVNGF